MTKKKLMELYNKLWKSEITKNLIIKLKDLTDEEIDIVLISKETKYIIDLFNDNNFKELPKEFQQEIINALNSCENIYEKAPHIVRLATNKNAISSGFLLELIQIIKDIQGINQTYKASLVACNFTALSTGKIIDIIKLIGTCEEEKLEIAYHAATNIHIAKSGKILETLKSIINAPSKSEALSIYYQIVNLSKEISVEEAMSTGAINLYDFWQIYPEDM